MEPIRLPTEKEISVAYEGGKEAVLKLFQDTMLFLAGRIHKLEDQLAKNSRIVGSHRRATGSINLRHAVYENAVVKGAVDKQGMLDIS